MPIKGEYERSEGEGGNDRKVELECDSARSTLCEEHVLAAVVGIALSRLSIFLRVTRTSRGRCVRRRFNFRRYAPELAEAHRRRNRADQERENDGDTGSPEHSDWMIPLQLFLPTYDSGFFWNFALSPSEQK